MTIQCDCPHCGRVCAFKDDYAGRTARCLNCQSRFVIPLHDGRPARLLTPLKAEPIAGFYGNAILGSFKAFVHRDSLVGVIFCTALVGFHFALGNVDLSFTLFAFRPPLVLGWVTTFITFGLFSWYSLETISNACLGIPSLPLVEPGSGFDFIWVVIKSCYLAAITLVLALLPASFVSAVIEYFGVPLGWGYFVLAVPCFLLWPINLAIVAMNVPMWRIFRYDLLVRAIAKSFWPYLCTTLLTLTAFCVCYFGVGFFVTDKDTSMMEALGLLGLRVGGVWLFLFAMRVIGVYCLHYADLSPELWTTESPTQAPGGD